MMSAFQIESQMAHIQKCMSTGLMLLHNNNIYTIMQCYIYNILYINIIYYK